MHFIFVWFFIFVWWNRVKIPKSNIWNLKSKSDWKESSRKKNYCTQTWLYLYQTCYSSHFSILSHWLPTLFSKSTQQSFIIKFSIYVLKGQSRMTVYYFYWISSVANDLVLKKDSRNKSDLYQSLRSEW